MDKGKSLRGVPRPHTGPKRRGGRVRGGRAEDGDREKGGRARLGYLSRGPRVPSYATEFGITQWR